MVSTNGGKSDDRSINDSELEKPKSDATSKETLSDIEETEKDSSLENPSEDSGPSPDGLLDEPGEIKDAGPM